MSEQDFISWKQLQQKSLSRRNLIRGAAGTAAGAGFLLGSGLRMPALAQEAAQETCRDLPRPIPHISTPPGQHFFFPGPVNANPMTSPNTGHDPSTVTDFQGMIGQADLFFTGTGTKLDTGESATYGFHTDWRFMTGVFIGVDGLEHNGILSFIWLDSLPPGPAAGNPLGLPASPLGFHSWDAGVSESLVFWTTPLHGTAKVDLAAGTASLKANNICSVFDAFKVSNSLNPARPLGFASGIINSLDIEWSKVIASFVGFSDPVNQFRGDFFQIGSVTIAVTATTPLSTGHGFQFVSDPASTIVNFAQIGSEHNGVSFWCAPAPSEGAENAGHQAYVSGSREAEPNRKT